MPRDTMNALIHDFGASLGVPGLAFDDENYLAFTSAEGVLVNLDYFEADETLVLYTTLGALSDGIRLEFYDEMLKANLFWELTLGATLCVSPDGDHALLTACLGTNGLDVPRLTDFFQHVNRLTLIWADRLRQVAAGSAEAAPPPRSGESESHVFA